MRRATAERRRAGVGRVRRLRTGQPVSNHRHASPHSRQTATTCQLILPSPPVKTPLANIASFWLMEAPRPDRAAREHPCPAPRSTGCSPGRADALRKLRAAPSLV